MASSALIEENQDMRAKAAKAGGHSVETCEKYYSLNMRATDAVVGLDRIRANLEKYFRENPLPCSTTSGTFLMIFNKTSLSTFIFCRK